MDAYIAVYDTDAEEAGLDPLLVYGSHITPEHAAGWAEIDGPQAIYFEVDRETADSIVALGF